MKKIILALFIPVCACSQKGDNELNERIRKVENSLAPGTIYGDSVPSLNLEERMKQTGIAGLSIAVIKNYKIDWAKAYGYADVEEKRKANTETRFQAASISKSVNSLGILKLAEQGKLNTEADINDYLKTWKFPYDSLSKGKKITVNELLSHTAGLSIHGFPGYENGKPLPTIPQILDGSQPANTKAVRSLYEPGKQFKYSGGGTTLSQLVLMDITGKAYEAYMQQEVLNPLGMTHSFYNQPPADTKNLATGHYRDGRQVKGKYHVYPEQAAAGLWTTPTDLAKYIIECQLAYEGKSSKLLSKASMQKRMTPYNDKNAALGVFIEEHGGVKYFNHNGGNEAFLCTSYGSLQGGNGVVIMINGETFAVVEELLNSVIRVYGWQDFYKPTFKKMVKVPKDSLDQYVGSYLLGNDTLTIKFRGEKLCIQQNREPAEGFEMLFSDNTSFSIKEVGNTNLRMLYNNEGKIDAIELKQGSSTMKATRIK